MSFPFVSLNIILRYNDYGHDDDDGCFIIFMYNTHHHLLCIHHAISISLYNFAVQLIFTASAVLDRDSIHPKRCGVEKMSESERERYQCRQN